MKNHEALKRFDELSVDGQQAAVEGNLAEYLIAQDPETLIEQITEEIVLAGPDTWKAIQGRLARRDELALGDDSVEARKALVAPYSAELYELSG